MTLNELEKETQLAQAEMESAKSRLQLAQDEQTQYEKKQCSYQFIII